MREFPLLHPRDQIAATMGRIYRYAMTTTSGGNLSVRDEEGSIWVSPARVDKGRLQREDIVRIKPDGEVEGRHPPSSETPFHRAIYQARPDIKAIIHAHPGALVSFSMCGQLPDTRVFPETYNLCGEAFLAPYALPGSEALGKKIAAAFARPSRPLCVVLENHGVVVGGPDLATAFTTFEAFEFAAATLLNARQLGDVKSLSKKQLGWAGEARPPLPESALVPVTIREKELRKEICAFVHRAYEHRLMTSAWGSFSARVDESTFVITPRFVDRASLGVEDMVPVRDGRIPFGAKPSRAVRLHQTIYRHHPDVQAVVNALPLHASAFGLSEQVLDTRTIPESYVFLKDVAKLPFKEQFGDAPALAKAISLAHPAIILENNGAITVGRSILDAFDRMEILESTAAAIIRSRVLGPIQSMPEPVVRELEEAFGVV